MAIPANTQNDCRAMREDCDPKKKATALVKDVMVIEGPACEMASSMRLTTGILMSVWSTALHTTNMSSTPMPSNRKGSREWMFENLWPSVKATYWQEA